MSDLVLPSRAQMRRSEPFFPLSRGLPRVDDRRMISRITLRDPARPADEACAAVVGYEIFRPERNSRMGFLGLGFGDRSR